MTNRGPMRVCAIHDLSAYGRCALTVVIPALSACGIQTIPLPTALMSTHTGGFDDIYIRDLTEDMRGMYSHWQKLGVDFDAIYSGFVLHAGQGEIIAEVIDSFKTQDTLVLVDPVMGDHGELYSTCTPDIAECMARLCAKADLITPNLTEACILSRVPYPSGSFSSREEACAFITPILSELSRLCGRIAVTGIEFTEGGDTHVMCACFDGKGAGDVFFHSQKKEGASYPGTGELFASVLLGLMMRGCEFESAVKKSSGFVLDTIVHSEKYNLDKRAGTALETSLMNLSALL